MPTSPSTSDNGPRWYQNIGAAFIFFTRIPLWKWIQPPREAYSAVVEFWPLVGWLTGGVMAAIIYFGSMVLPYALVLIAAIVTRILLTGAIHEDGLGDFVDGFGGGGDSRERIMSIMKDSHVGTYAVLTLIVYMALLFTTLFYMPPKTAALAIIAADPFSKMLAGQIVQMMPYARTEAEAKNRVVYRRPSIRAGVLLAFQGLLPFAAFAYFSDINITDISIIIFVPCIVMYFMYLKIWHKLQGYTGDCCGALFLLIELSLYLAICVTQYISISQL